MLRQVKGFFNKNLKWQRKIAVNLLILASGHQNDIV
jgi:hypothetical protein